MLGKLFVLLLILLAFVGGFATAVALQSDDFVVTRTKVIDAPPPAVFELVNDFNKGKSWSPWMKDDPDAKLTIEGKGEGKGEGAIFKWNGNNQMGEGWQEIVEVKPNELVRTELHFVRPFEGKSNAKFVLKPAGNEKTELTWTMNQKSDFVHKAMCLVMRADKMIGDRFEEGLNKINTVLTEKKDAPK